VLGVFGTTEWIVVGGVATVAAMFDLRTGRVPNVLTFGAVAAGVLVAVTLNGLSGLGTSLLGCVVGLALFFPLFALGGMGAGDVKLLAAFGAWLGPVDVFWAAIWASLVGGGMAIVVGAWSGYLSEAVRNLLTMGVIWHSGGASPTAGLTLRESRGPRLAYAVPIGIGAIVALWLRRP
jgi:prepilin peptidase CpaA